ncbi:hypothetical protein K502DRAFT_368761 [Neoconidiobolus thromboides FSU 785]|nr:hypothetical protein K502DRAFT_368761 [Neoconidiobolus thromboides FSU 785]
MSSPNCTFVHDNFQFYLSNFILFGMFISYLPQHYKIIKNKSSDGISSYFLLLGSISGLCNLINILINQRNVIQCCSAITLPLCLESLLGVLQIFAQWWLFFVIFILYYVYFPEDRKLTDYIPHIHQSLPPTKYSEEWQLALWVKYTVYGHLIISVIITSVLLYGFDNMDGALLWANFNGLFSMLLAMIQYLPQIFITWKRKNIGVLSIPMMMMQTPGAFLFVFSLALREGTNWTTWITYLVTGILQGTLLIMCLYFQYLENLTKIHAYEPIYIGIVQNSNNNSQNNNNNNNNNNDNNNNNITNNDDENNNENTVIDNNINDGESETEPLLNNHNQQANYEYQKTPQLRTKSLLSKWKKTQFNSKLHLVHHSLASNLSENDDTLL